MRDLGDAAERCGTCFDVAPSALMALIGSEYMGIDSSFRNLSCLTSLSSIFATVE
jgi:hypothetical protein